MCQRLYIATRAKLPIARRTKKAPYLDVAEVKDQPLGGGGRAKDTSSSLKLRNEDGREQTVKHTNVRAVLRHGESARTTLAHIIRADGSVGLYRITASTNPQFTTKVIEMMRAQVYEPPLLNGSPVAVRGEISYRFTR